MEQAIATFTIVARDPHTGELAVAVQSKMLAVGSVVPWAKAGVGAVATQAWANVSFGMDGLTLLEQGHSAQEVVSRLIAGDTGLEHRQLGVVDHHGHAAALTGSRCIQWAGHRTGAGYCCLGNDLASEKTIHTMAEAYEASAELPHLADRLVAALSSVRSNSSDSRGRQSAALYVVREKGGYAGFGDRLVDLRVDDHAEPLEELARLLELHRQVWLSPTPPERYLLNSPDKVRFLQSLLREVGVFDGAVSGELTYNTRGALATYCALNSVAEMHPSGEWLPGTTMSSLRQNVLQQRAAT